MSNNCRPSPPPEAVRRHRFIPPRHGAPDVRPPCQLSRQRRHRNLSPSCQNPDKTLPNPPAGHNGPLNHPAFASGMTHRLSSLAGVCRSHRAAPAHWTRCPHRAPSAGCRQQHIPLPSFGHAAIQPDGHALLRPFSTDIGHLSPAPGSRHNRPPWMPISPSSPAMTPEPPAARSIALPPGVRIEDASGRERNGPR